jgi:hypothetical protein
MKVLGHDSTVLMRNGLVLPVSARFIIVFLQCRADNHRGGYDTYGRQGEWRFRRAI